MERFAMKIDNNFKSNVFKICRLCGIDNPHKVAILEEVVSLLDGEDELPLYKKIFNCIGIQVSADDKMPKTICALCFDKINDFHEFREMCYSTNAQTRKLLGLQPQVEQKWNPNTIFNPIASEQLESLQKRNRKRKNDDIPPDIKFDKMIKLENQPNIFMSPNSMNRNQFNIIKTERDIILERKIGKRNGPPLMMCNICQVNFCSITLLQSHLLKVHVPIIARYHCVQCNETISNSLEIKNHNLWHRLSKTPFQCGRCDKKVTSLQGLTRHMRECSKKIIRTVTIIPNIECKSCSVEFATKTLYYMHSCVTCKLRCPKCNCKMSNPITTLKHIATCSVILKIKDDIEDNFIIKNEPIDMPISLVPPPSLVPLSSTVDIKPSLINNNLSMVVIPPLSTRPNTQLSGNQLLKDNAKKNKKKIQSDTEDAIRRCDELLKNTMKTLVSIKHEPVEDGVTNVQSTSTESIKQLSLNINSGNPAGQDLPAVRVKQEVIDEGYRDTTNIEINIKQEIIEKVQPALKLKIKKEHGTLNASFIPNEKAICNVLKDASNNIIENQKKNKENDELSINDEQLVTDNLETVKELVNQEIVEKTKKTAKTLPIPIKIKQEIIDKDNTDLEDELPTNDDFHHGDYDSDNDNNSSNHQDLNISIISNEKKTSEKCEENSKIENFINKPEISPMLTISSVSSAGNVVKTTTNKSTEGGIENVLNTGNNFMETDNVEISKDLVMPQILSVSGGVNFPTNDENENIESSFVLPQITSISSGVEVASYPINFGNTKTNNDGYNINFNHIKIKTEKLDPGYNDIEEYQQDNDQQSLKIPDINNINQYDTNFIGDVRIKQEIEFAEEGFGDEVRSECSEDDNDSDGENEFNNHINQNNKEMEEVYNNDIQITTINDNGNMNIINSNRTNYENIKNNSNNNGEIQNGTDLDYNFSIDTNIDSNFIENSISEYVNNDSINNTNKMPIISQVNSINLSDIYKIQNINSNNNNEKSEIPYSQCESINQNYFENSDNNTDCNLTENNSLNQNIESNNLINSINHPNSGTSTSSSLSSLNNSLLESALTVPEYKNINEIAENHNNENLEKLLRYETTTEQIPQIRPTEEDLIRNLDENVERQQEIDTNNESINPINNSNISLDNITINNLPPTD